MTKTEELEEAMEQALEELARDGRIAALEVPNEQPQGPVDEEVSGPATASSPQAPLD